MDQNWDRIVRDYLGDYYNEGELMCLCQYLGIDWEELGGRALSPKDKIDGILKKVRFSHIYHDLLCEMTVGREPVFLEARLHTHLFDEGTRLVDKWIQFYWRSPEEYDVDPEKWSKGSHFVFQTLRKVQDAYLQAHLSNYLKTTASTLQAQGKWREAGDLLEEYYADLPDSTQISDVLKENREVLRLCGETRDAMEENNWGKANSVYESLISTYPSCSSYPEVGKLRAELERFQEPEQARERQTDILVGHLA